MLHAYCELCGKRPITPGLLPSRPHRLVPESGQNLLRFYLNATYLAYSGKFYKQTFGTAMGWGPPCRSQWQT